MSDWVLEVPGGPEALSGAQAGMVREALERHGLQRRETDGVTAVGRWNDSYRVETEAGAYLVRVYRAKTPRGRVALEHRAMALAAEAGVPVPLALATADGRRMHSSGGRLVAVFPWAAGEVRAGGKLSGEDAEAMGAMHGKVHAALAGFADPALAEAPGWDARRAVMDLDRVDDLIMYYPSPGADALAVQAGLRVQRGLLESGAASPWVEGTRAGLRAVHGGYGNRSVRFADGAVTAVVDWEGVRLGGAAEEVTDALARSGLDEGEGRERYLAGYRRYRTFTREEAEQGVEEWWQRLLHETGVYRERFIEGNRRMDGAIAVQAALVGRFAESERRQALAAALGG